MILKQSRTNIIYIQNTADFNQKLSVVVWYEWPQWAHVFEYLTTCPPAGTVSEGSETFRMWNIHGGGRGGVTEGGPWSFLVALFPVH